MTTTPRLTRDTAAPAPGILHLGPGAFFRAFIAPYVDEAMMAAGGDWGITAVSLQSPRARDALAPQNGAYMAVERGPEGDVARQIGSIRTVLVAPEDPQAVIAAMAAPETRIVTLTVTEKGYCHNPRSGRLQADHPDILHDLVHPQAPRSAIGFLVAGLERRFASGLPPFTVLSCDNLPANGRVVRQVVLDYAARRAPALADRIADQVAFPACMVDRITPATTPDDIAALAASEGVSDPAMVVHEPFRQWVIEDQFPQGRPAWEAAGAQMVTDVEPHELMKLRCLNGTHSTLAYLGYLAGHETISEAVADAPFAALCERLWHREILPTIPVPQGENLPAYCAALLTRYRNPAIRHRTWQIAMDGSQKLPQRILGTVRDNLAAGRLPAGLCLAIAGWMRYAGGIDEAGTAIDVRDPLADELRAAAAAADPVAAFLAMDSVFGADLASHGDLVAAIRSAHDALASHGAAAAVRAFAS